MALKKPVSGANARGAMSVKQTPFPEIGRGNTLIKGGIYHEEVKYVAFGGCTDSGFVRALGLSEEVRDELRTG